MEGPGVKYPGPHDHWFDDEGKATSRCCGADVHCEFTGTLTVEAWNGGMTPQGNWPDGLTDSSIVNLQNVTGVRYFCSKCGRELTFTWEANSFYEEYDI